MIENLGLLTSKNNHPLPSPHPPAHYITIFNAFLFLQIFLKGIDIVENRNTQTMKKRNRERGNDKTNRKNGSTNQIEEEKDRMVLIKQLNKLKKFLADYARKEKLDEFDKNSSKNHNPFLYTPLEVAEKGLDYLEECIDDGERPTVAGLSLNIGLSMQGLRRLTGYSDGSMRVSTDKFTVPINSLKSFIAYNYERDGRTRINPSFYIFLLKNLGMEDKQVVEEKQQVFTPEDGQSMREKLKKMLISDNC